MSDGIDIVKNYNIGRCRCESFRPSILRERARLLCYVNQFKAFVYSRANFPTGSGDGEIGNDDYCYDEKNRLIRTYGRYVSDDGCNISDDDDDDDYGTTDSFFSFFSPGGKGTVISGGGDDDDDGKGKNRTGSIEKYFERNLDAILYGEKEDGTEKKTDTNSFKKKRPFYKKNIKTDFYRDDDDDDDRCFKKLATGSRTETTSVRRRRRRRSFEKNIERGEGGEGRGGGGGGGGDLVKNLEKLIRDVDANRIKHIREIEHSAIVTNCITEELCETNILRAFQIRFGNRHPDYIRDVRPSDFKNKSGLFKML